MSDHLQFYIGGRWVDPSEPRALDVINPATEEVAGRIALGGAKDVDLAVAAARDAFESYSRTTRDERLALLERIATVYQARYDELATTISTEVGAPIWLSRAAQAATGLMHLRQMIAVLKDYAFEEVRGTTLVAREPVGVCGFITPWNWPVNQILCKVAPALAAGCTMVLKPSEVAPLNAILIAEILHEAGVPAGVFNLVNGDGPGVGAAISAHPGIDLVSFTGSTRAGILVAKAAADTVKRVAQELGGKSANVILDDADFVKAIGGGITGCVLNSGQSCNAPTRMLVPASRHAEAVEIARAAAAAVKVGDPFAEGTTIGPVVSEAQWNKIQGLIQQGIDEGATLVTGGTGRPEGLARGYYVRPTVFADVGNDMTIAREEIFGPVLSVLTFRTPDEAVAKANNTPYGLSAGIWTEKGSRIMWMADRLRAGVVWANTFNKFDPASPFGGFKESGYGKDMSMYSMEEYTRIKHVCVKLA